MKYESSTNRRLRNPSRAKELAIEAVQHVQDIADESKIDDGSSTSSSSLQCAPRRYRVVLGLGPGRSGTKSLTELLAAQTACVHAEHEMVVRRRYRRDESGRIDPASTFELEEQTSVGVTLGVDGNGTNCGGGDNDDKNLADRKEGENGSKPKKKKKGSWGSDRRLEWDAPRLVRGATPLTEKEEATWRVLRLLEQRFAFDEWISQHSNDAKMMNDKSMDHKPRKLGARGWRKHNSGGEDPFTEDANNNYTHDYNEKEEIHNSLHIPVVAAVSSVGLAYVHEYIALDPTVRIVVLMRPREEVVESFLKKSKGRNHWQRHERRKVPNSKCTDQTSVRAEEYVQPDKTWDSAFPNMSPDECRPFASAATDNLVSVLNTAETDGSTWRPDNATAIRAYWELYNNIVEELCQQYPSNIRMFDMEDALNEPTVQEGLLKFCGFDEPVLDTSSEVHLNKKKK